MDRPYLIGIAGASCSGKTTVARILAGALEGRGGATSISLDSYYYDLSELEPHAVATYNLDVPDAINHKELIEQVRALADGKTIEKPVYDHKTHTRSDTPQMIEPPRFVIFEGLFALYWNDVRKHLDTQVFIDASHEVCLERRIYRDRTQRDRTPEEVTQRYHQTVGPMFDAHVLPTRQYANVIVDGLQTPEHCVEIILGHIHQHPRGAQ